MDLLPLTAFDPRCELVLPRHEIPRAKFPVTDLHTHFGRFLLGEDYDIRYDAGEEARRLREMGIRRIVNLDGWYGPELERMLRKTEGYEDFYITFGGVDVTGIGKPGFEKETAKAIRRLKSLGGKGIKFFKDMSLVPVSREIGRIMPDDPRLKVVWETAAQEKLVVLIHIADPVAFFKPVDRFNERYEELHAHPGWSFYGPDFPAFETLMAAQENLLAGNPQTTFVIAHVGSYAENLAQVGGWLDRFPNLYVDIAARIAELGRQPYTARAFLHRYQDRVLYGSDYGPGWKSWPIDFRFLETFDESFRYDDAPLPLQGRWNIYGVGLEDGALQKIYSGNAMRLLGLDGA